MTAGGILGLDEFARLHWGWLKRRLDTLPERVRDRVTMSSGDWQSGDELFLATDAIAQWALGEHVAGREPFGDMPRELGAFRQWLSERQTGGAIRNDDVTVVCV